MRRRQAVATMTPDTSGWRPMTIRRSPMRIPRALMAAGGITLLIAPVVALAGGGQAGALVPGVVRIYPGVTHLPPKGPVANTSGPPTTAQCEAVYQVACYQPSQIQDAYNLAPLFAKGVDGKGETIVIVDSYGSPTIASDLNVFDKAFGLPAPPSLTVIQPAGPVPPYVANENREGWES